MKLIKVYSRKLNGAMNLCLADGVENPSPVRVKVLMMNSYRSNTSDRWTNSAAPSWSNAGDTRWTNSTAPSGSNTTDPSWANGSIGRWTNSTPSWKNVYSWKNWGNSSPGK